MTAIEPVAEPVAPAPQPDRTLVAPVVDELARTRESLTEVANWLHGHWPADMRPPQLGSPVRVSQHVVSVSELLAARRVLDHLARPDAPPYVRIDPEVRDDGWPSLGRVVVELDTVEVAIQAERELWLRAFPDDAEAEG